MLSATLELNDANEQTSTTLNGGTPETRTYDSWGRLATRAQGTYSATYGYRYGGRLYNFTSNFPGEAAATFEYRGDGRLHRRTVGTDIKVYRYDAGWNAINTEDNAGALQAASVYEPGQSVGQRLAYSYGSLGTGTVVYAYHDQLGSTRRWRLNKSSLGANEYEPYGEAYAVSFLAPRDYALHEWDPAIAAYRAPYRNYSPSMARWMTRDPLGMVDGPNMYGYVGGEPISFLDEFGFKAASQQTCNSYWKKIVNLSRDRAKRIKEYNENKYCLPETTDDDNVYPSKSRRGHRHLINKDTELINNYRKRFLEECTDTNGKPRYPIPNIPPQPGEIFGPPNTSLEKGCPTDMCDNFGHIF